MGSQFFFRQLLLLGINTGHCDYSTTELHPGSEPPLSNNNYKAGWVRAVRGAFAYPNTGPGEWLTECFQDRKYLVIWEIKKKSTVYTVK